MKPYYEEDGITIYHGDCREVLPLLPAAALIFFDPPYGLGIAAWDSAFDAKGHADLCWANICDGGSIYATCSPHILAGMLGLFSHRRLIAWGKPNLPLRKNLNRRECARLLAHRCRKRLSEPGCGAASCAQAYRTASQNSWRVHARRRSGGRSILR
jgi:hypothetical protein